LLTNASAAALGFTSTGADCRVAAEDVMLASHNFFGKTPRLKNDPAGVGTLRRVDQRPIDDGEREVRAFMTVRDEMLRLPETLSHYRRLGVARFFVVDNASTDGTTEFVLAQPDCHLFTTTASYAESGHGVEWQHALLNKYGVYHWCVVVDADEWLIYPGYERHKLSELAAYLQCNGAEGMFAFLLDMYGSGPVTESMSEPGRAIFDSCRYFDSRYEWRRQYVPRWRRPRFPPHDVVGGPRLRWFFPVLHRHYYLLKMMWEISYRMNFLLPMALRPAPALGKIPFLLWLPGTQYKSPHATTPIRLAGITGALLHFKFLQDFYARVVNEINRKEHWDGASEYARYLARLKKNPSASFYYSGSVEYRGSDQLVRLGLLREDPGWSLLRAMTDSSATARDQRG
jgi:glycosyltransferase involved in cell wall biosynthesis